MNAWQQRLGEWLLHSGGLSSATIIAVLVPALRERALGHAGRLGEAPSDPSDLNRCLRALEFIPKGEQRLGLVAKKYPFWSPLVEHWAELKALHAEELPSGHAPKTWARMCELRGEPPPPTSGGRVTMSRRARRTS